MRRRALLLPSGDGRAGHARRAALALAGALCTAASHRAGRPTKLRRPAQPTSFLCRAGALIQNAATPAAVARALVEAAIALSGAASAVWWEHQDRGTLTARTARGVQLAGKRRTIPLPPCFWQQHRAEVTELSLAQPEHLAFLENVRATHGFIVPGCVGRHCVGALSIHDGDLSAAQAGLLMALTQQGAAALRALELEADRRQVADKQHRCTWELGLALGSALSLDELLRLICESARSALEADACLMFLSEPPEPLRLRAHSASPRTAPRLAPDEFAALAECARRQPPQKLLCRSRAGLRGPSAPAARQGFSSALGLPLAIRGDALGCLILLSERAQYPAPVKRRMMLSLAAQAAVTIENLLLIEDLQGRLLEMADLTWVSTRITSTLEVEGIAATVVDAASKALDMPRIALFLTSPSGEFAPIPGDQLGVSQDTQQTLPRDGHLGADCLATGIPHVVTNVEQEGRAEDPLVKWLGARSLLCVPMVAQEGLRGIFVAAAEQPRVFGTHTVALLSAYANQTALALRSALLYQDVVRHLNQLTNLFSVSQTLASSLNLTQTLEKVLDSASELLDAPVCSLMLMDPDTGGLAIKAARGLPEDQAVWYHLKAGEGLAGRAAQSQETLVSADVTRDGRFRYRGPAREAGLRAAIVAPLVARGRTVGVLNLYRKTSREFGEDDGRLVSALANAAAVAIENARLYEQAQERAQFLTAMMGEINHRMRNTLQAITGLLQRELDRPDPRPAEESLARAIARIQSIAVVHDFLTAHELQFVDIKQVARRILQLACQNAPPHVAIEARVSGARVLLPSDQATKVAMILGELADNAVRHGLAPSGRGLAPASQGKITINLAEAGSSVLIEVRDNGVGVREVLDLDAGSGLGLRLVRGIVEKELEGSLEFDTRDGLTVRARLPKQPVPSSRS